MAENYGNRAFGCLRVCAIASGSKGNCVYVGCGGTHLLVDCGIPLRDVYAGLRHVSERTGLDIKPEDIAGIFVTHEHSDHIKSCAAFCNKWGAKLYGSAPTLAAINAKAGARAVAGSQLRNVDAGTDLYTGDINITPFKTPHDAAYSLGYRFDCGAASFALATDIGHVNARWLGAVLGARIVMLEANHDVQLLRDGPYPETLKRRILSDRGHLSNDASAEAAVALTRAGAQCILLSHLSETNNLPRLAFDTVCEELQSDGFRPGEDVFVSVLSQYAPSDVFMLDTEEY